MIPDICNKGQFVAEGPDQHTIRMNKNLIIAVKPYKNPKGGNFKLKPYEAWQNIGGRTTNGHYPRILHKLLYTFDCIPTLWQKSGEARLCFVQPYSLYFDTWHSVMTHEVIPFIWDCWEEYDDMVCSWIERHRVKSCVFTSRLSARRIQERLPYLNILVITEGIDTDSYDAGKELADRSIDFYSFGRQPKCVHEADFTGLNVAKNGTDKDFRERIRNSKTTIAVPRCDAVAGCHETLTQRYWECMLSRMVMIGRAPKELTDLIGYNPLIEIDYTHLPEQIHHIKENITDYQPLVDRNRQTALRLAPWELRMTEVREWLEKI